MYDIFVGGISNDNLTDQLYYDMLYLHLPSRIIEQKCIDNM